ncbi:DUF4097 family beta strand repeat protein [Candidatus Dojkabacteria bacterium]|nr:DUF4097 family beta strand repeat protein [Candidatus Dojkabacteria bacterium]
MAKSKKDSSKKSQKKSKTDLKESLDRFFSNLGGKKYNLKSSFDFTSSAEETLNEYFKSLEILKDRVTSSEYEEIESSLREHFYVVLSEKVADSERVTKNTVDEIIEHLGDPEDMAEYYGGEKKVKMRRVNVWKKVLWVMWLMVKWFVLFILFVGVYFPLVISAFSVALSGIAVLMFWWVDPVSFWDERVVVTSTLGWLTPFLAMGLVFMGTGVGLLLINIITKIHWKKAVVKGLFIIASLFFGVVFTLGPVVAFFAMNRAEVSDEENWTVDVEGDEKLVISEIFGSIEVVGDKDLEGQIEVNVERYSAGRSNKDAETNLEDLEFSVLKKDGEILVTSSKRYSMKEMFHFEKIVATLRVPADMEVVFDDDIDRTEYIGLVTLYHNSPVVTLKSLSSDLNIEVPSIRLRLEDIDNHKVQIKHSYGSTDFKDVKTDSIVFESNAGSLDMQNIDVNGDLEIKDRFGSVDMEEIEADNCLLDLNSGSIDMENMSCDVKIDSQYGSVDIVDLNGDAQIDARSGSVDLESILGNASVVARYGSVDVNGMNGDLVINASSGSVDVYDLIGTVDIRSRYGSVDIEFKEVRAGSENMIECNSGSIDLAIPRGSHPDIRVSADRGSVDNEFSGRETDDESPVFTIEAEYGSVDIVAI